MKKIELLAPVGNRSMLEAGLSAGADSFYMALDNFGARAYAENFNIENIKEVIDYVHLFGKKVFITINTLIKDQEIEKVLSYIEKLYEYGTDAILFQDIGLFSLLKDKLNQMEIHASTQMAVRDYYGAKALMNLGYNRIVIARECPYEEIKKIASLDVDTEVFVHGSLCVSFSGECLMSSFIGKRSANRGRCAGACRKKYQLISDQEVLADDYFLNMNDLNTIDDIQKLVSCGVDSLKIEGRMKSSEYVLTVVKNYRKKIEESTYSKEELTDVSNRAYTKGFIFGQKRDYISLENSKNRRSVGRVLSKNKKKYFIANSKLLEKTNLQVITDKNKRLPLTLTKDYEVGQEILLEKYPDAKIDSEILMLNSSKLTKDLEKSLAEYKNIGIEIKFEAQIGKRPKIQVFKDDIKIQYQEEEILERAKNISIKKDEIIENLSKLNDTVFFAKNIQVDMDEDVFIRKKDINNCRRVAIKKLEEKISSKYHRPKIKLEVSKDLQKKNYKREINIELLDNQVDIKKLAKYDNIYIREYDEKFSGLNLYYILDSHMDYEIGQLLKFLKEKNIKGVVFNNYKDLCFVDEFRKNNIKIRIGRYLNVFNEFSFKFYSAFCEMISSSVENTFDNINKASDYYPVEMLAYGPIELMTMVHCPFSVIKKCGLVGCENCKFKTGQMKDQEGNIFDVKRYKNYSKIYSTKLANIDKNKISDKISLLYLVSSDKDFENIEGNYRKFNLNYERGVL